MAELKWIDEEDCQQALAAVRNDSNDVDWACITYAAPSGKDAQKFKLLGQGEGGLAELKESLTDGVVGFALLRQNDTIDNSVTVKFVFINWVGTKVRFMQKARISVHLGGIKKFIGQTHVELTANTDDELTQEVITTKVMDTSGSGSRVLDAGGVKNLSSQASNRVAGGVSTRGKTGRGKAQGELTFDEDAIKEAIASVRSNDETNWCLATYEDSKSNHVVLAGSGSGGVEELKGMLQEDRVGYGFVSKTEQIDMSVTKKFCFIRWVPGKVAVMKRARLGTHSGGVKKTFHPFHVDLSAEHLEEVSDEILENLIGFASGQKCNVLETTIPSERISKTPKAEVQQTEASEEPQEGEEPQEQAEAPKPASKPKKRFVAPAVNRENVEVVLPDEEGIRAAIQAVRNDGDATDWCLVTYDAPKSKTLVLGATGEDGFAGLKAALQDDQVCYCLLRMTEQVDQSTTIKFVFVNWVGSKIHRMQRAKLSTHKGAVHDLFAPFHIDLNPEVQDEMMEELIMAKIKKAAGTANYVQ